MKYKICIVTTVSSSIDNWIKPLLKSYHENNFEVTIVCNMDENYISSLKKYFPYVKPVSIDIPRGINLIGSVKSIRSLYKLFEKGDFDLVQYSTPNASFYSAIASYFARVPKRLYCQWGMVFVGMEGLKRSIFEFIERTTCKLSTEIQPDSYGNLEFCRENKFYSANKSQVIWNGSAKGVDLDRFDVSKKRIYRDEIIKRYEIPDDSIVLGFVGRLGKEKGCNELFLAFKQLSEKHINLILLFVGPIEKEETIKPELLEWFFKNHKIIKTDRVTDVEKHMAAMDVFILPSYREGFGMSVVEAEAMGVPVIVSNIPGPTNAMVDGQTGIIIPVKSSSMIVNAVDKLITDKDFMQKIGNNGVTYAIKNFDSKIFIQKLIENRKSLIES